MIYQTYNEKLIAVPFSKTWHDQVHEVNQEFKAALAAEYLPTFSEKTTDEVWDMAWGQVHSGGYAAVEMRYAELVTLVINVADRVIYSAFS